ncbi:MAG: diaminopimelate decarboxylase [Muribaculaceae bacterium]
MKMIFPIEKFSNLTTPFYYYDIDLLEKTLTELRANIADSPFEVHYAMKANANEALTTRIMKAGLGADCVSGWEVKAAIEAGFDPGKIVFAGVGKTDAEINYSLEQGISCFNIESEPELRVINELALAKNKIANVAIRVNPNIDAHTHKYITTGLSDNKFGINLELLDHVIDVAQQLPGICLKGLHFHIGSQLTDLQPYEMLCDTINELQQKYEAKGVQFATINVGGGLGIDYSKPDENPIADFRSFFNIFKQSLKLRSGQTLHFELGRSVVAQCGALITRVTYVKQSMTKSFAIVDAGMSDLIRPALYQAHHVIQNITSRHEQLQQYDVVGPICESADTFDENITLPLTERGDMLAIRSAGAYGEIMASHYNLRPFAPTVLSVDCK